MPIPRHRDIRIGTPVSIVLKADQRTGRQVQGTVAQLLTRGDHPRGVKVRLSDGRVGRVQQLSPSIPQPSSISQVYRSRNMDPEHNPWATSSSQGNPYNPPEGPPPSRSQYGQQGQQTQYDNSEHQQQRYYGNTQDNQPAAPAQRLQRSDTDNLLSQQPDGAEQLEHMQNFEATARETDDDKNQAQLQKEFPSVDSSLIAALYSDTKDVSTTREMLQELSRG